MDRSYILNCISESLAAITLPRFFETERGYQGELLVQLSQRMKLTDQIILEQEYQKKALIHGLTLRPDIIMHEPFDADRHSSRQQGNLAVIELKLKATAASAQEDFRSIAKMVDVLGYPLGVFVNIDATDAFYELVPESIKDIVACFAVRLTATGVALVRTEFYGRL